MLNKKGFSLIETIVTVVVLTTALLLLYNSYSGILSGEKRRLYYDDVSSLYKTAYIKSFIEANTPLIKIKNEAFVDSYTVIVGPNYEGVCSDENACLTLTNLYNNFNINQIVLLHKDYFNCTDYNSGICNVSVSSLSTPMRNYIKTLNSYNYDYYLIVEYSDKYDKKDMSFKRCIPMIEDGCQTSYATLEI